MDLRQVKTIAVVGLSARPNRPSNRVAAYLQSQGYRIIPVNPLEKEILGETAYPDLLSLPKDISIDIVDIFRRAAEVGPVVEQAIQIGAKMIWMQEGIINEEARQEALQAGLEVVMDRCLLRDHQKMAKGEGQWFGI